MSRRGMLGDLRGAARRLAVGMSVVWSAAFAATASAQTVTDGRTWWTAIAQERSATASPWRWYAELQGRTRDGVDGLDQLLVRPAVGRDLTPRSSLWCGYGYTPTYLASGGTVQEHRVWQQYLWAGAFRRVSGQWRSRVEQRWIEGAGPTAWRLRQFVRASTPLPFVRGAPTIIVWDEVFMHLNDTRRTAAGFDQNRIFVGVGLGVAPGSRLEVGYLNQAIHAASGADRRHHAVLTFLNATF